MYRIKLRAGFLDDIEIIRSFVSAENPRAARELMFRIFSRIRGLAAHPHLGRPGRVPNTRELVIAGTPFIVPYRVLRPDEIEILAVLHGARRWPSEFPS